MNFTIDQWNHAWKKILYKSIQHIMKGNLLLLKDLFIRNLKNKISKHMTSISKNVCIDKLDDIVNKYVKHNIE